MATRQRGRRRKSGGGNSDFTRITGLWKPSKGKSLGTGGVELSKLEELVEDAKEKGHDRVIFFLLKNDFAESKRDPRYVITVKTVEDEEEDGRDDDNRGSRRSKKRRPPKASSRKRSRRDEEEDEDEDEEDDLEDDDEDDEDVPF